MSDYNMKVLYPTKLKLFDNFEEKLTFRQRTIFFTRKVKFVLQKLSNANALLPAKRLSSKSKVKISKPKVKSKPVVLTSEAWL